MAIDGIDDGDLKLGVEPVPWEAPLMPPPPPAPIVPVDPESSPLLDEPALNEPEPILNETEEPSVSPSVDDLASLILHTQHRLSVGQDIERLFKYSEDIAKLRKEALLKLSDVRNKANEKATSWTSKDITLENCAPSDLQRLQNEGIISPEYTDMIAKLISATFQLENKPVLSEDDEFTVKLNKDVLSKELEKINASVKAEKLTAKDKAKVLRREILQGYADEVEKLRAEIELLRAGNPEAAQSYDNKLAADRQSAREAAQAALELEIAKQKEARNGRRLEILKKARAESQSIIDRQKSSLAKIEIATGITELQNKILTESDPKAQDLLIDQLKDGIYHSIIDGEGENQIKYVNEIAPWLRSSKIDYNDALENLSSKELQLAMADSPPEEQSSIDNLSEHIKIANKTNKFLKYLIGRPFDYKTRRPSWLKAAFDERVKNDANGITAQRAERRAKARAAEAERVRVIEEDCKPILERGGFLVATPPGGVTPRNKNRLNLEPNGAVRLEKKISNKTGKPYYIVAEAVGPAAKLLTVGATTSLEDMGSFPDWLAVPAREHHKIESK